MGSSGTGVRRFVDGTEPVAGHVGVDLGRREICVAEELLDRSEVGTAFEQVRSVRVAEGVRVEGPAVGQRMPVEHAPGVTRRELVTPPVEEDGVGRRRRGRELGPTPREPRADGVDRGRADAAHGGSSRPSRPR